MVRKEVCIAFDLIDKEFNNTDRLKQAKMALENLNIVENKLFKMRQYVIDEEYTLSERQKWAISTLKDIFAENFIDLEKQKREYRYFLSDIYWTIYDFFYDYGNKDPNLYKYELNCIYPYICLFKSQLNIYIKENEIIELAREQLLEFFLEYESSPVMYKAGDDVKNIIKIKRYHDNSSSKYEYLINLRGNKKELSNDQMDKIEKITISNLDKLIKCASMQTASYLTKRILDGVHSHLKVKVGGLNISINLASSEKEVREITSKYIDKIYDILK